MKPDAKRNWTQGLFVSVVILSAASMALYKLNLQTDNWQDWSILLALEALRAALVLSNIGIRRINVNLSYVALGFSILATVGLAMMSHFHVVEIQAALFDALPNPDPAVIAASEEATKGLMPVPAIHTDDWWMLQTINALLLFCEWSMSVVIAGEGMNWRGWAEWIEQDFKPYFDESSYQPETETWLRRVAEKFRVLQEWREGLEGILGTKNGELSQLTDLVRKNKEKAEVAETRQKELGQRLEAMKNRASFLEKQRHEAIETRTSFLELLENIRQGKSPAGEIPLEILPLARMIAIGSRTSNMRLSIGQNKYVVHCSGLDHVHEICPPFEMKKAEKSKACPCCGKVYSVQINGQKRIGDASAK